MIALYYGLSLFSTLLWQWSLKGTDLLKKGFFGDGVYRFFDLTEERTAILRDNSAKNPVIINIFFFLPRFVDFSLSEAFPSLRKLYMYNTSPPPSLFSTRYLNAAIQKKGSRYRYKSIEISQQIRFEFQRYFIVKLNHSMSRQFQRSCVSVCT